MSNKTTPQPNHPAERPVSVDISSNHPVLSKGFSLDANRITYSATPLKWALLVRAMNAIDSDLIQDDLERACFELWREAIQASVEAAFAKAWLGDGELDNANRDVREYLGG